MVKVRASDSFPITVTPLKWSHKYIIEEAKAYLDETILSSHWGPNEHVDNVVNLGKHNSSFIMEFMRSDYKEHDNMYSHFLLDVIAGLYPEIKFEGYVGIDGAIKTYLALYDNGFINDNSDKIDFTLKISDNIDNVPEQTE